MTRYEKMCLGIDDALEALSRVVEEYCPPERKCDGGKCEKCWGDYLMKEVEE